MTEERQAIVTEVCYAKELKESSMARNGLLTSGEALLWAAHKSSHSQDTNMHWLTGVDCFPDFQKRHQEDINNLCHERRDEMGKSLPRML